MNLKIGWIGFATLVLVACGIGVSYPFANPINQPLKEQQTSRASGFTMKAAASAKINRKTGTSEVMARLFATGPMHKNEVIRMEGQFSLITPSGQIVSFGPMSWTFSDDLKAMLPVASFAPGSKVKIKGFVHVYHREDIKSERELMPNGSVRLYMNTGTVSFSKVSNSRPPKLEVECIDLKSVHSHGLELLSKDRKFVSNRILLSAGKQLIDRQTLPFMGRKLGLEPYLIRQLIPKRSEPMELIVPVQQIGP